MDVINLPKIQSAFHVEPQAKFELQVCCRRETAMKLAVAIGQSTRNDSLRCVLQNHAPVFLFASASFVGDQGEPPETIDELVRWASGNLVRAFDQSSPGWSCTSKAGGVSCDQEIFESACHAFQEAKSNRELRRALAVYLVALGTNPDKARRLIKKTVGKKISPALVVEATSDGDGVQVNIERLFDVAVRSHLLETDFDEQLLIEKLASMKELAYGASHEINNPLANIATRAQSLMSGEASVERKRKLGVIYRQAMRAHEMISDMMLFGHPPELRVEEVDLKTTFQEVIFELKPELDEFEIKVRLHQYPDVPVVWADPTQLAVAFKALVRNSIQAIDHDHGQIEVRLWRSNPDSVSITVNDNGAGVDARSLRHMFDPFFSGREAGRGLGFGLSKSWTIIDRLHGGKLGFTQHSPVSVSGEEADDLPLHPCKEDVPTIPSNANSDSETGACFVIRLSISGLRPSLVNQESIPRRISAAA